MCSLARDDMGLSESTHQCLLFGCLAADDAPASPEDVAAAGSAAPGRTKAWPVATTPRSTSEVLMPCIVVGDFQPACALGMVLDQGRLLKGTTKRFSRSGSVEKQLRRRTGPVHFERNTRKRYTISDGVGIRGDSTGEVEQMCSSLEGRRRRVFRLCFLVGHVMTSAGHWSSSPDVTAISMSEDLELFFATSRRGMLAVHHVQRRESGFTDTGGRGEGFGGRERIHSISGLPSLSG